MGTEIYYNPDLTKDDAWTSHIDHRWNRQRVSKLLRQLPGLTLQEKEKQSRYKISYFYCSLVFVSSIFYILMTISSAKNYYLDLGSVWKGRRYWLSNYDDWD